MEQVIREYGGFLLSGTAVVFLIIILFTGIEDDAGNKGALAIIGAQIEIENTDYHSYTDFQNAYQTESSKTAPEIVYQGGHLTTGTVKITDYIKAEDYAGRLLQIRILSIVNPADTEITDVYNPDTEEITLTESGIYTVTVSALDDINRLSKCVIKIPVNK